MPRKGENIYKRKDGRWEGRYIKSRTCTGKIVYGYVYAKTYREVKAKLREQTPPHNPQPVMSVATTPNSFSTVASDWFESVKSQTKESTRNKYHNMLTGYILPTYGEQTLDNITYGVNANVKGEAMVAAVEGEAKGTINILGLEITGKVGGYAGAVGVEGKVGIEDNKFVLEGGAAALIGGSAGIEIGFNDEGWDNFVDFIIFWD